MNILCKLFKHRVIGDNFYGHHCKRCGQCFDWGILECYRWELKVGDVITIPKIKALTTREI